MAKASSDADAIIEAYQAKLADLYKVLFEAYVVAKNKDDRNKADQRFAKGLMFARDSRDSALKLLGP
jgi:hypothetical protein